MKDRPWSAAVGPLRLITSRAKEISAVERDIDDLSIADNLSETTTLGSQQRSILNNCNQLGDSSGIEHDVQTYALSGCESHTFTPRLFEPFGLDCNVIDSGFEVRDDERTIGRDFGKCLVCGDFRQSNFCVRNEGAILIPHLADELGFGSLRIRRAREQETHQKTESKPQFVIPLHRSVLIRLL